MGIQPKDALYFAFSSKTEFKNRQMRIAIKNDSGDISIVMRPKNSMIQQKEKLSGNEIVRIIKSESSKDLIFFIIEDLFTNELAEAFRALNEGGSTTLFISNIRTNISLMMGPQKRESSYQGRKDKVPSMEEEKESPSDLDILINNAWQHMWIHTLQPAFCMLKFRAPFFNEADLEIIKKYASIPMSAGTIGEYKSTFGHDLLEDYKHHKYYFVDNDHINLQVFAGSMSSETRLVSSRGHYETLIEYNCVDHENRLYYYNLMRDFAFVGKYSKYFGIIHGFDGCTDCAGTFEILARYIAQKNASIPKSAILQSNFSIHFFK